MGNEGSTTKAFTALPPKEFQRLHKKIVEEYPWLSDISESMLVTDYIKTDNPIIYANEDFHRMTQYGKEEVIGFNCRFLQGKHTNQRTVDKVRQAVREGKELEVELLNYRKDGTPFINNFLLIPVHARRPDEVTHFLAIQKDVTYISNEISDPTLWKPVHLALWLEKNGFEEFVGPFIDNDVTGAQFLELNAAKLKKLGFSDANVQLRIQQIIERLCSDGPNCYYDFNNSSSLSDTISESSDSDLSTFTSTFSSLPSEVHYQVDLHKPRQIAYWKRNKFLNDRPQSSNNIFLPMGRQLSENSSIDKTNTINIAGSVANTNNSPRNFCVLTFYFERNPRTADDEVDEEDTPSGRTLSLNVFPNSILFHVLRNIKRLIDATVEIELQLPVNGIWTSIITQSQFIKYFDFKKQKPVNGRVIAAKNTLNTAPREVVIAEEFAADGGVNYVLLIHQDLPQQRAITFDTVTRKHRVFFLESAKDIFEKLVQPPANSCFVVPCSSVGLLPTAFQEFEVTSKIQRAIDRNYVVNVFNGEIPLGKCFLVPVGFARYVIVVCSYRTIESAGLVSYDHFYQISRAVFFAVHAFNRLVSSGNAPGSNGLSKSKSSASHSEAFIYLNSTAPATPPNNQSSPSLATNSAAPTANSNNNDNNTNTTATTTTTTTTTNTSNSSVGNTTTTNSSANNNTLSNLANNNSTTTTTTNNGTNTSSPARESTDIQKVYFPILTKQNIFFDGKTRTEHIKNNSAKNSDNDDSGSVGINNNINDSAVISNGYQFGVQFDIAFRSFSKFTNRKNVSSARAARYTQDADKRLMKVATRENTLKLRLKKFQNYLSSGELSHRGLLDDIEIQWLVDACAAVSDDPLSPFNSNRRIQRLATITFSSLIVGKYFKLPSFVEQKLRSSMVSNPHSFNWLMKMACVGSVAFWPTVSFTSLGQLQRIASGATCTVYKTQDDLVAKLFNCLEKSEDILKELAIMSLLSHPNLLPIISAGHAVINDESQYFCVCPYAEFGSLYHVIQNAAKLGLNFHKKVSILMQITEAFRYLHACGVIHRDLKSLNVLVTSGWRVYVADVGASRIGSQLMTSNIGTPLYMAPEVFFTHQYTDKVDVYSFGILLFELLTESLPYSEYNNYELPALIKKGLRPTIPANITKPWARLMQNCWQEKAIRRPSFDQIADNIVALQSQPAQV